ncbi:hypothetical protein KP509_12G017800 [Ceratopteris richardii]|uniref:K Homology domain-containing protein n=1 Tax=Ceratopteris richardii TaxID=49495 RepID=A0A8T2TMJ1_CERRI|nr:hypothetical protein KP509_12G017800 [Ceratopteris richardii]
MVPMQTRARRGATKCEYDFGEELIISSDSGEVIISSDSEDERRNEQDSDEDWVEDVEAENVSEDVDDEDEEEDDEASDGEEESEYEEDDDDDDSDGSLYDEAEDEVGGDNNDDDVSQETCTSSSEQRGGTKSTERITSRHLTSKSTVQETKWSEGNGPRKGKAASKKEDKKLFSEALKIIRGGNMNKLRPEHCKAYLRHYSLRLTGSRTVLHERVLEHVELKVRGGMSKYPRVTFSIDCTGDACTGDVVLFRQRLKNYNSKAGANSTLPGPGKQIVAGRIVKESYGTEKQQHTFTVEVLWNRGPKRIPYLYPLLIKGRNLYRFRTFRQPWKDEKERIKVLKEKHSRGDLARNAREDRISGKTCSYSRRTHIQKSIKARFSLRKESNGESSRTASKSSVEAQKDVKCQGGDKDGPGNVRKPAVSMITIEARYAGILIGTQGRTIGSIERASGARLHVCDHPSPILRAVNVNGTYEQVQVATRMVVETFRDRGLPPPLGIS